MNLQKKVGCLIKKNMGTVVNQTCHSVNGGSHIITCEVPDEVNSVLDLGIWAGYTAGSCYG